MAIRTKTTDRADEEDQINNPGAGNTDLTGQARDIIESTEKG